MTPISEMTNAELDELIAKLRGWEWFARHEVWLNPTHRELGILNELPSSTTDPRYAMELLIELPIAERMQAVSVVADKLLRSISEKYAIWKGEK